MRPIRNSAKAIIIQNGKILLTKNLDEEGIFYLLPGGGQEKGENLIQALQRECMEEIGVEVVPEDIVLIREYIGKNHEFPVIDADIHQVEYMFNCLLLSTDKKLLEDTGKMNGTNPDDDQVGVEWVCLESMDQIRLYPNELKGYITTEGVVSSKVYIGDVN